MILELLQGIRAKIETVDFQEDAKRDIRSALDRSDARRFGQVARAALSDITDLSFTDVKCLSGTVKFGNAIFKHLVPIPGTPWVFEVEVSLGPGKSTPTGRGDLFGDDSAWEPKYKIWVRTGSQEVVLGVVIDDLVWGLMSAMLTCCHYDPALTDILKAVREFAVSLGVVRFTGSPSAATEERCTFWYSGE